MSELDRGPRLPPAHPPRKRRWLLALTGILLALWTIALIVLAVSGR